MTMWIAGVALLAGVLGLGFAWPVLRPREVRQQRLEARDVLAEEWQALDRRRADGELTAEQHQSLQAELGQRLLNETASPAPDRPADTAASGKRWLLLGGLTTLVLTGSLYWRTGRPDLALAPPQTARSAIGDDMVQKLAARLAANPGDRAGWAMLGHSYYVLENYDGAVDAFARIAGTLSDDPDLLAEYAIALSLSSVEPRPHAARPLLEDASRLLPDNSALRVFLARDMLANGETGAAIAELEAARELEKADPLRVKFIESMIEEARHPR
ncbi:TPR repeat protein [Laribacter hongkongensis HLHK9]|uniref:TPR repeat protein n=1 Tax=Laribacter hongkongensis (strain HLHK9) TaxID=557598 RepID=C1D9H6_LARHH|nr:c-type cytochrome biogenesis protein CcmI [Laribacter hongkongensis]ACO75078.1 TPR repeat protein [Laribacter hongkongensis HLHK9]